MSSITSLRSSFVAFVDGSEIVKVVIMWDNNEPDHGFDEWCRQNRCQLKQWAYSIYQLTLSSSDSQEKTERTLADAINATLTNLTQETEVKINAAVETARLQDDLTFRAEKCDLLHQINVLQSQITMADEHARTAVEKALNDESSSARALVKAVEMERKEIQDRHYEEITRFIQDYVTIQTSPVKKGAFAEVEYEQMLVDMFPESSIERCGQTAGTCDLRLQQTPASRPILLEIKSYSRNVPQKEIDKFVRDLSTQQCHGIMISVTSGITHKSNMMIDMVDGQWVALYLPNHKRNEESLRMAVDLIQKGPWVKQNGGEDDHHRITERQMAQINELLRQLMLRDTRVIEQLKAAQRSLSTSLIKDLTKVLVIEESDNSDEESSEKDEPFVCSACDYTCATKGGMTRHTNKKHKE